MSNYNPMRILMGVDGSEHSQAAAEMLNMLPFPPGSEITALAAFQPRNAANIGEYELNVHQISEQLRDSYATIQEEVLAGNPAEVITHYAEEHHSELIVLGARGLRSAVGVMLGGVAQQVVEYSHRPVLIVRAPYTGLEHILLVTDGSEHSQLALKFLCRFPLQRHIEISVMHVLQPEPLPISMSMVSSWPVLVDAAGLQMEEEKRIHSMLLQEEAAGKSLLDDTLNNLRQSLEANNIEAELHPVLARGDAADEILKFSRETPVQLIVAGSRGLSGVRGWLLGSVSRKLLHYAPCSVMVVRG